MTLDEIKQQYPDEWVLIDFTELDEELKVIHGEVIAHSPDKAEIHKKLLGLDNKQIAIEFTGEFEDRAYSL